MDKAELIKELETFGLSKKEALVYITSLQLGSFSIDSLAHNSKLKRPTCYFLVYNLMHKGLISQIPGSSSKSIYIAEHPRNIAVHIRKNLYKAEQLVSELEKESIMGQKPIVKVYRGQGGVEQVYEDMIEHEKTSIKAFIDTASLLDRTGTYFLKDWIDMRKQKEISIKSLTSSSSPFPYKTDSFELRDSKSLPPKIAIDGSLGVYQGKVIYLSNQSDDFAIIVDNIAFSKTIESIFDYLWNLEKK